MSILQEEAGRGNLYTSTTFAEKFENQAGLGGQTNIRARINVLATKGYIKFLKGQAARKIGLAAARLRDGYLCVEGLMFATGEETTDPESGEVVPELIRILPSHFKCPQTGASLPVENPEAWVYQPEEEL